MASFAFLEINGKLEKVRVSDGGVLQSTVNAQDFEDMPSDGGGGVESVTGDSVDNTDPLNPIITSPGGWTEVAVTPGQNVDITVTGETAYCIEVSGYIVNGNTGASTLSIQPNASAADGFYEEVSGQNTTPLAYKAAYMGFGGCGTSLGVTFQFRMFLKTGIPRQYFGSYTQMLNGTIIDTAGSVHGVWTDTTTAITSLRLHSDRANGFQAGTVIRYRLLPEAA